MVLGSYLALANDSRQMKDNSSHLINSPLERTLILIPFFLVLFQLFPRVRKTWIIPFSFYATPPRIRNHCSSGEQRRAAASQSPDEAVRGPG